MLEAFSPLRLNEPKNDPAAAEGAQTTTKLKAVTQAQ